ncbi:hypothetical protein BHE74_00009015 [Ensete ventricosum]|nr:hypothetical protein GW17_00019613 [Ensete ventricosum]RWW82519.1 hypothetical protein BHE74_00009015 [Ensete ventricosum]RZR87935.1 hypothetical protein BHM03_00015408 [Ensete ventricosum]
MKNPWNNIISLLPLQKFMSLNLCQRKDLCLHSMFHLLCRLHSCDLGTSLNST